jgi:hypothetical protein
MGAGKKMSARQVKFELFHLGIKYRPRHSFVL